VIKKHLAIAFLFILNIVSSQTKTIKTDLIYKVIESKKLNHIPPVIILLHGYGSNEEDLFDIAKSLDERYTTFLVRAPFPAPHQGFAWFNLTFLPEKKFRYNYKQVVESRKKILSFINSACKTYNIDSTQVFLIGYSQGAMMAYDFALNNPSKIKGIDALSGMLLPETKRNKTEFTKLAQVTFFIAHGTMDNVVAYMDGEDAAKYLQSKKIKVSFKNYEISHTISRKELGDLKNWLKNNISTGE
jgi:phospholipase/carboxylesterase